MDLKVECQKTEANKINAPGTFIHCMVKTPGTNRLNKIGRCLKNENILSVQKCYDVYGRILKADACEMRLYSQNMPNQLSTHSTY